MNSTSRWIIHKGIKQPPKALRRAIKNCQGIRKFHSKWPKWLWEMKNKEAEIENNNSTCNLHNSFLQRILKHFPNTNPIISVISPHSTVGAFYVISHWASEETKARKDKDDVTLIDLPSRRKKSMLEENSQGGNAISCSIILLPDGIGSKLM